VVADGLTLSELRRKLEMSGFEPSKSLGQNFLVDKNLARKIADEAYSTGYCRALEIGPGFGSLTGLLADRFDRVVAVEADRILAQELASSMEDNGVSNVEVVQGDILRIDPQSLVDVSPTVAVSNLPYNIASQVILRLLERAWPVESMVFMVQAELADRMLAPIPGRNASAFGVRVALFAHCRVVAKVGPGVFHPVPKVASKVVRLDRISDPISVLEPEVYRATVAAVRLGFNHRRQMLRRTFGGSRLRALTEAGIEPSNRPENLSVEQWIGLGRRLVALGSDQG
jgi:16S rRNA (adenine1518-N6/adenine1519-N6)-dimethyltransferase